MQPKDWKAKLASSFLVNPVLSKLWQQKNIYISITQSKELFLSCLGFLFVCFRRQRVRVQFKSLTLNRACHCC